MIMTIAYGGVTTDIPAPSVFNAVLNTLQKSAERNSNGTIIRETLPNKWSLELQWEFQNPQDSYDWFTFLMSLTRVDFVVNFPAPTGNIEQATCYISPISATMLGFYAANAGWWKTVKCNFVEE